MAGGFWVRQHGSDAHASTPTPVETEVLSNAGSSIQENRSLTVMGYYLTMFSELSNLYMVRLLVVPEMIDAADLTDLIPEDDDGMVWAKHYAHKGTPGYFQIKSKRTLHPDDHVFVQSAALSIADSIEWSWQAYVVGH